MECTRVFGPVTNNVLVIRASTVRMPHHTGLIKKSVARVYCLHSLCYVDMRLHTITVPDVVKDVSVHVIEFVRLPIVDVPGFRDASITMANCSVSSSSGTSSSTRHRYQAQQHCVSSACQNPVSCSWSHDPRSAKMVLQCYIHFKIKFNYTSRRSVEDKDNRERY